MIDIGPNIKDLIESGMAVIVVLFFAWLMFRSL